MNKVKGFSIIVNTKANVVIIKANELKILVNREKQYNTLYSFLSKFKDEVPKPCLKVDEDAVSYLEKVILNISKPLKKNKQDVYCDYKRREKFFKILKTNLFFS